jgi:O-antigen ligase
VNLADNKGLSTFRLAQLFFFGGVLLIAQTSWRPFLSFTLSDWFFLAAFLGVLPELLRREKLEVPFPTLFLIGLGLILVGGLLSTPGAKWPQSSLLSLTKMVYLIGIWFWVGTILLHSTEDIQKAMIFWAISVGVTSAAAAAQLIWGHIIPGTSPNWGRMTGFAEHVNDLGGVTSVALVPALYVATHVTQSSWISLGFWFIACLIVSGLVWSGSLTGVLAAVTGLMIWVVLNKGSLKHVFVLIIGGGMIVSLVSLVPMKTIEKPKTVVAKTEKTMTERTKTEVSKTEGGMTEKAKTTRAKTDVAENERETAERAMTKREKAKKASLERAKTYRVKKGDPPMLVVRLQQLKERALHFDTVQSRIENFRVAWKSIAQNVFVGVGMGDRNGRTEAGRLVHNLWLRYWYEGGILAFLGFFLIVGAMAKQGIDNIKFSNLRLRPMSISIFSAFSAFLVLALAQPGYFRRFQWFPALLILTLNYLKKADR